MLLKTLKVQQAFLPDKFQTGKQDYLCRVTLFSRQFSSKTPEKRCHLHSNHNFRNHWDKFWCNPIYFSRRKCLTLYKTKNLEAFAPRNDFSLCCKHLNRMITSQWASQEKLLRQAKKDAQKFLLENYYCENPATCHWSHSEFVCYLQHTYTYMHTFIQSI